MPGILGAQLEDVPDLDSPYLVQSRISAPGTEIAFLGVADIGDLVYLRIPGEPDVREVIVFLVGTGHVRTRIQQPIVGDDPHGQVHRPGKPARGTCVLFYGRLVGQLQALAPRGAFELGLVHLMITPHRRPLPLVGGERLEALRVTPKPADLFDGSHVRGLHLPGLPSGACRNTGRPGSPPF